MPVLSCPVSGSCWFLLATCSCRLVAHCCRLLPVPASFVRVLVPAGCCECNLRFLLVWHIWLFKLQSATSCGSYDTSNRILRAAEIPAVQLLIHPICSRKILVPAGSYQFVLSKFWLLPVPAGYWFLSVRSQTVRVTFVFWELYASSSSCRFLRMRPPVPDGLACLALQVAP